MYGKKLLCRSGTAVKVTRKRYFVISLEFFFNAKMLFMTQKEEKRTNFNKESKHI